MKKSNLAVICNKPESIYPSPSGNPKILYSGSWKINTKNIGNLWGSQFSIHTSKKSKSYLQGTIVGATMDGDRTIIHFEVNDDVVDGLTLSWGQEKAYY